MEIDYRERVLSLYEAQSLMEQSTPEAISDGHQTQNKTWAGSTWEEAKRKAAVGDPALALEVGRLADQLLLTGELKIETPSISRVESVAGSSVDVGKLMSGEPECMVDFVLEEVKNKTIWVQIHVGQNAGHGATEIQARASAAFAVVAALEKAGYSVGIEGVKSNVQRSRVSERSCIRVIVKEPGQYVDMAVAAYWICGAGVFRRCWFHLQSMGDAKWRRFTEAGETRGQSRDLPEDRRRERALYFGCSSNNGTNAERYLKEIVAMLRDGEANRLGLELAA